MAKTNAEMVRARRRQLRAQGLRPVQLWLPDTRTPEFAAQVAQAIGALAKPNPEDEAILDSFNRAAVEDFVDWT